MSAAPAYDWDRVFARLREGLTVSAIVVSYRTGPALFDCLRALLADPDVHEIVVVDNGNPFRTTQKLEEIWRKTDKMKIVGEGVNRGFAAGVNLGAEHARGDRLLIINPDAVLRRGSVAALEMAHATGAEPVVVGGRIFGEDGVEQRGARRRRLTLGRALTTYLPLGKIPALSRFSGINRNLEPLPKGPTPMDAVSGALMYLSRHGFDRLRGFDETYFLHVEDLDICRRAELEGGSVVFTPHAGAYHFGATSDAPAVEVERHKGAGMRRYFTKFASTPQERLAAQVLGPIISGALVMRAKWRKREAD